ncbi:DUF5325 family protein [Bacillus massiliigorillae]|uniref:DUF5325 family protein n=1 Tax=Bacillus massiliigorillae TaxID=1243664 RepID=UPI00039F92E0|nr:DUF5325 family protein [Bacillus massiliigorillae]
MKYKLLFLLLALLATSSMAGVGISIAYRSIIGIILSILAVIIVMGMGFSTKAKLRTAGKI